MKNRPDHDFVANRKKPNKHLTDWNEQNEPVQMKFRCYSTSCQSFVYLGVGTFGPISSFCWCNKNLFFFFFFTLPNDLSLHFLRQFILIQPIVWESRPRPVSPILCNKILFFFFLRVTMRIPPRQLERDLPLKKTNLVLDLVTMGKQEQNRILPCVQYAR